MIFIENTPVKTTIFPDGTSQVWQLPNWATSRHEVDVKWIFQSEAEVMHLVQLSMLLHRHCVNHNLFIDYLPYARQDKSIGNEQTFSLFALIHVLDTTKFGKITVIDPHSSVFKDHSKKEVNVIYPYVPLYMALGELHPDMVVYPDQGAKNKYSEVYTHQGFPPSTYGEKKRDQKTGQILEYTLFSGNNFKDQKVLIVDDICDGGATFILLAKALFERGAKEVSLFVTHGIFSKGIEPLKEAGIGRIFTKNGEVK